MEKPKITLIKTEKGFVFAEFDESGKAVPCEDKKLVIEKDGIKIVDVKKEDEDN